MARQCLPHAEASPEERCPRSQERTRCAIHEQAFQWWRDRQPTRRQPDGRPKYDAPWQAHSRQERRQRPTCVRCGSTTDLTLDHATGLVGCRSCHRPDAVGGLMR